MYIFNNYIVISGFIANEIIENRIFNVIKMMTLVMSVMILKQKHIKINDIQISVIVKFKLLHKNFYEKGLDDLMNLNSFTIAVFIGLAYATRSQRSLDDREECRAGASIFQRFVIYEVVAFSFFLLSSLLAKTLKMYIAIFKVESKSKILRIIRVVMLTLATLGSAIGCFFFLLSMIHLVEIRLGRLSCESPSTWIAAGTVMTVAFVTLIFYVPIVVYVSCMETNIKCDIP